MRYFLSIQTFDLIGAQHFHGTIVSQDFKQTKFVSRRLTSSEAQELNILDRVATYKKGHASCRYISEKAAIQGAKVWLRENGKKGDSLVYGRPAEVSPRILIKNLRKGGVKC